MTATALWAAVVVAYESKGLITLTNIRDRSASAIDTTVGESAAQQVIDLFPLFVQADYDAADARHVAVGMRATIAELWERGGSAAKIAKIEGEEVYGDNGLMEKLRQTSSRARPEPDTNSGVTQSVEQIDGQNVQGWSDLGSQARGTMPSRVPAE